MLNSRIGALMRHPDLYAILTKVIQLEGVKASKLGKHNVLVKVPVALLRAHPFAAKYVGVLDLHAAFYRLPRWEAVQLRCWRGPSGSTMHVRMFAFGMVLCCRGCSH
jgi:hypothetical protein